MSVWVSDAWDVKEGRPPKEALLRAACHRCLACGGAHTAPALPAWRPPLPQVFYRERGASMYDPFAYGVAIALVEMPYLLIQVWRML